MSADNQVDFIIEGLKNIKAELKDAILGSKLLSYFDKLDLIENNDLSTIHSWSINIEELIPNVIKKYPTIKEIDYGYYGWHFSRGSNIYFTYFTERIWEQLIDWELISEEEEEAVKEFIAMDFYEHFLKTNKIGFCYDW